MITMVIPETRHLHFGLCEGRHEIKTNEGNTLDAYIFSQVDEPLDFIGHFHTAKDFFQQKGHGQSPHEIVHLYITGLTSLLTATLLAAEKAQVQCLILMHYDRESGNYLPQDITPLL
jgi:hypothetical protein|tara:strand:+ start:2347 stop:2697 length:351 start_codon:yes stop_codon:yes gene_type:complete